MKKRRFVILILACLIVGVFSLSAASQRQRDKSAQENDLEKRLAQLHVKEKMFVFKTIGTVSLAIHVFEPVNHNIKKPLPAIVFFFGGGWAKGTPEQFFPHCRYLASRGMVACSAEYRVSSRHGTSPFECVADGKSAVRWIRAHAGELGIDPTRIAAGGGSAGGHVALCTALIQDFDEADEDLTVSSKPNALVLFNPVVDATKIAMKPDIWKGRAQELSPVHHVTEGLPPAIIFHGTADTVVPIVDVERFCTIMKEHGNTCTLVPFEGMPHAFFNFGNYDNKPFLETIRASDHFLSSLGYIRGKPDF